MAEIFSSPKKIIKNIGSTIFLTRKTITKSYTNIRLSLWLNLCLTEEWPHVSPTVKLVQGKRIRWAVSSKARTKIVWAEFTP